MRRPLVAPKKKLVTRRSFLKGGMAVAASSLSAPAMAYRKGSLGPNWLWGCFEGANFSESLFLLGSDEGPLGAGGGTWTFRQSSYPSRTGHVRDPNLFYNAGKLFCAHTNVSFGTANTSVDLAVTSNFHNFNFQQQIDFSSVMSGGSQNRCWGPRWFVDSNNDIYLTACCSSVGFGGNGDLGTFVPYWVKFTDTTNLTTYTSPVAMTGTFAASLFDNPIFKIGSTYYMFYRNTTDPTYGPTVDYIEAATSTSPMSGYVQQKSGNWMGMGGQKEGIYPYQNADGTFRMIVDGSGNGYYYIDSATSDPLGSWGSLSAITNQPFTGGHNPQNGKIIDIRGLGMGN